MSGPLATSETPRQEWLDALRGIAILAIVFSHVSYFLLPDARAAARQVLDPGTAGVTLFFLVTGYIVPATLERRGDLRRFWITRLFRLYPLLAVVLAGTVAVGVLGAAVVPAELGRELLPAQLRQDPVTVLVAHATLLPHLLGVPKLLPILWFLSYTLTFYVFVSALYTLNLHRRSAEVAIGFAGVALLAGGVLPSGALATGLPAARALTAVTALALAAALAAMLGRHRRAAGAGALGLSGLLLVLVATNQQQGAWHGFSVLALMFAGAALYRAHDGQISWRRAGLALGTALVFASAAGVAYGDFWVLDGGPRAAAGRHWTGGLLLGGAVFVAAMLRWRRPPRALTWLGTVSYSVFLLHMGLLLAFLPLSGWIRHAPAYLQLAALVVFLAVLLPVCQLTYRHIELPGQRLGRRLAGRGRAPTDRSGSASLRAGGPVADHPEKGSHR